MKPAVVYNGIALGKDRNGRIAFTYKVELDDDGMILRASGFSCPEEGTSLFDNVFRRSRPGIVDSLEVRREDPKAYMDQQIADGMLERLGAGSFKGVGRKGRR
jgi:hypothetical protein